MPVKTPPPPKTKKGEPPAHRDVRGNLSQPEDGESVALNFRVPAWFKKEFKVTAATHGLTQSNLLHQAFDAWKEKH